jgi:hypothetical protein
MLMLSIQIGIRTPGIEDPAQARLYDIKLFFRGIEMKKYSPITFLLAVVLVMTACIGNEGGNELIATFDGNDCRMTGPSELPVGEHPILSVDNSGIYAEFTCNRFLNGKSYQDLLDAQPSPGEFFERPSFVTEIQLIDFEWNKSRRGYVSTFNFDTPGDYSCYFWKRQQAQSAGTWLCGPIKILKITSY